MTDQKKTYYHLVLDRSGSMSSCWAESLKALSKQYESIQSSQAKYPTQEFFYSYCFFNDQLEMSPKIQPIADNLSLPGHIFPSGLTALHDAVGGSVEFIKGKVGKEIKRNPNADVVMLIITDGEENASRNFSGTKVQKLIKKLEATEKWTFLFVGLDVDIQSVVKDYHLSKQSTAYFRKSMFSEEMQTISCMLGDLMESKQYDNKIKPKFS